MSFDNYHSSRIRNASERIFVLLKAFAVFLSFATLSSLYAQSDAGTSVSISDVRIGVHPEKTRVVLDLSANTNATMFTLEQPARLVVDLPNGSWQVPFESGQRNGGAISNVRYGRLNQDMARLVLDLAYPVEVVSKEVLGGRENAGTRIVFDLKRVSSTQFTTSAQDTRQPLQATKAVKTKPAKTKPAEAQQVKDEPVKEKPSRPEPEIVQQKPEKTRGGEVRYRQAHAEAERYSSRARRCSTRFKRRASFVIIIDPGHGGRDPGAIGSKGTKEADVVLVAAKAIKAELDKKKRYKTVLTREANTSLKLRNRIAVARKQKADLFISVHADSLPDAKDVRGHPPTLCPRRRRTQKLEH